MRILFQGYLKGKKSQAGTGGRILATANVMQNKLVLRFESETSPTDLFFESLFPSGW